jgi:hypothetical protein
MQTQFCWIHGEECYNFGSMTIAFPSSFCMKHTKLKNLDLLYLKIYKSSIPNVRICCVLCYA